MSLGGIDFVADMMNNIDRSTERKIFDQLGKSNPDLAQDIRGFPGTDLALLVQIHAAWYRQPIIPCHIRKRLMKDHHFALRKRLCCFLLLLAQHLQLCQIRVPVCFINLRVFRVKRCKPVRDRTHLYHIVRNAHPGVGVSFQQLYILAGINDRKVLVLLCHIG